MSLVFTLWMASFFAQDPQALIQAAHTQINSGRLAEAEQTLREALVSIDAAQETRVAAHQILGALLASQGRAREAWTEIGKALALEPSGKRLGGVKHAMAMASWITGDADAAARLMNESVDLLKGSDEVWEVMVDQAGLEMARGNKSLAAQLCREALPRLEAMREENHPVLTNRAFTCAVIQLEREPERAERQLRLLLESRGPHTEGKRAILLAQIARARLRMKRLEEASSAIDDAVAMARTAADNQLLAPFLDIRAKVLRAMKRKKEAAECELEAAELTQPKRGLVVDARAMRSR